MRDTKILPSPMRPVCAELRIASTAFSTISSSMISSIFTFGQEVDDVFGAAIEFGVSLLPPEALGFEDGDALQSDLIEGVLHLIELEGLDDRFDLLHLLETPPRADAGAAGRGSPYGLKEAVSVPEFSTLVACEYGAEVARKRTN